MVLDSSPHHPNHTLGASKFDALNIPAADDVDIYRRDAIPETPATDNVNIFKRLLLFQRAGISGAVGTSILQHKDSPLTE